MTRAPHTPTRKDEQRAAAAGRVAVPGFPEFIARNPACRLCGLVETHPDLLRGVHTVLVSKSGRPAAREIAELFVGAGLAPAHRSVVDRHLKHIALAAEIGVPDVVPPELAAVEREAHAVARAHAALDDNYAEAWALFSRLRKHLDELDRSIADLLPGAVLTDKPPLTPDAAAELVARRSYALLVWTKLVTEARKVLETIHRMQRGDAFLQALVEASLKHFSLDLTGRLRSDLTTVLRELDGGQVAEATSRLRALVDGEIAEHFLNARQISIETTSSDFKVGLH